VAARCSRTIRLADGRIVGQRQDAGPVQAPPAPQPPYPMAQQGQPYPPQPQPYPQTGVVPNGARS
jgi:putative ABC transport system ATP-binding protein